MDSLDTIMSERSDSATETNAPAPQPQQAEPQVSTEGQARDPHGRFAPQEQAQPAQEQAQPQEQRPPDGYVPIQALDARLAKAQERYEAQLRERDQAWERRLAQFQPPKQEPVKKTDFFENPDEAFDQRLQSAIEPVTKGQQGIVENFSRMLASEKYGEDAVKAAYSELANRMSANPQGAQFDYQRIMASPHPFGELVKWHKSQTALSKYGDDPDTYIKAEVERLMAANGGQPQQQSGQPQTPALAPGQLPSSFSNTRSSGPSTAPTWNGPRPLSEIKPK